MTKQTTNPKSSARKLRLDETITPNSGSLVDAIMPQARELTSQLRFSPSRGRIMLGDRRMVLMQAEALGVLREELSTSVGSRSARGLLTRMGYAAGCRDAEAAWRMLGDDASMADLIQSGGVLHSFQGFVGVEFSDAPLDEENYSKEDFYSEWVWKYSIEADAHVRNHGISEEPACWFSIGYSSGYLSTRVGRRILVREIECRAMGHQHCRCIAKPASQWKDVEDDLSFFQPQQKTVIRASATNRPQRSLAAKGIDTQQANSEHEGAVGASLSWTLLRHRMLRVANTKATVLILGESGVGKSKIASELHDHSPRADGPFIEVNCAAIPEQLIESELFGSERGAFSGANTPRPDRFEAAEGGTLFLDEIATLSLTAQGKLLRVLQSGSFERLGSNQTRKANVRIVAATNEDLKKAVEEGRFREDLFFRVNVFPLKISPLRERPEDIPLLTEVILQRFANEHNRPVRGITSKAMRALLHHNWPGNIRELENVLERGVILAEDSELIDLHHLTQAEGTFKVSHSLALNESGQLAEDDATSTTADNFNLLAKELVKNGPTDINAIETALTRAALEETGGNLSKAARLLGLRRGQLDYRVKKLKGEES